MLLSSSNSIISLKSKINKTIAVNGAFINVFERLIPVPFKKIFLMQTINIMKVMQLFWIILKVVILAFIFSYNYTNKKIKKK